MTDGPTATTTPAAGVPRRLLHVGCGPNTKAVLKGFGGDEWQEIRLDIDPAVAPDIEGSLTDLGRVESESIDAVYSSHNLEHLHAHEVPVALSEFNRVLRADGIAVITCPDLQSLGAALASDRLLEPLYQSAQGPISAIDMLYGHRGLIAAGNAFMAHRCGFTYSVLQKLLFEAGFSHAFGGRREVAYDLWVVAFKTPVDQDLAREIAIRYLP